MKNINFHNKVLLAHSEIGDGLIDLNYVDEKLSKSNRKKLLQMLDIDPSDYIEAAQIHSDRILPLNEENTKMWKGHVVTGVDGFTTQQTDSALIVRVADCVPLVLYDPTHHALGVFHVGWRGAVKDIQIKGVETMITQFESDPKEMMAWLGPCAQSCCYQSKDKPQQADEEDWKPFIKKVKNGWHVDVPGYIADSLKQVGMYKKNMSISSTCTIESESLYSKFGSVGEDDPKGTIAVIAKLK